MYKKLICGSLLIMFSGFQLVSSLICSTCTSPNTCKNPQVVTCTDAAANATKTALVPIYGVLPNATGSYTCINVTESSISYDDPEKWVAGCYRDLYLCLRNVSSPYSNCFTCNTDLCTKDPHGNFSSSLNTIVSTVMAVIFAKIFART